MNIMQSDLVRRAAVIFRDHGYQLRKCRRRYQSCCGVTVTSIPLPNQYGTHRYFDGVTAAFDRLCPIIGNDDFTSRMVNLLRPAPVTRAPVLPPDSHPGWAKLETAIEAAPALNPRQQAIEDAL